MPYGTRVTPTGLRHPPAVSLPPLAGQGALRVTLLDMATEHDHPAPDAALFERMRSGGALFAGDWLAQAGLPMPAMKAESIALFEVKAA